MKYMTRDNALKELEQQIDIYSKKNWNRSIFFGLSNGKKMFIVTKEIDSENISKLCRTCLREDGDKMVCLFVGPAGSSLAAKLRSLSCLEVSNTFLISDLM